MNILLLAPHPFYIDRGTPIDVDILLRALSARGERVDTVVYHLGEERIYPGVTIHRIDAPKGCGRMRPGFSMKKLRCDWRMWRLAARLMRENQYDVVHAGEESVFIARDLGRRYGVPYIYDMDSSIAQQLVEKRPVLRPLAGLFNGFEARAIREAVACAPVCCALADLARQRGARRVEVLHDISQLADPDRQATGWLKEKLNCDWPILMYVGNLEVYQGVDLLVEAFARVRAQGVCAQLVIVGGDASDISRYRDKIVDLGIADRVHFLGRWPADELDEILVEADILTAPRIRGVNTPQKVFPYLHSGKAVLVTDLPTHSQILTPEICEMAPAEPEGFARRIALLIGDPARRMGLGRAGRAWVETEHVFEAHQRRVNRLYDYVADEVACQRSAKDRGRRADGIFNQGMNQH